MTIEQTSTSASTQLKEQMKDRLTEGLGVAAKAAGQQAGTLAQAVRQTGEELRQQGQEGQGKLADRIAQPIQRLSGGLSQADPAAVTDITTLKPKVTGQARQLKTKAGEQLKAQTQTRTTAAADGVNAVTAGVRQVGDQLRAQGQQTPALVLDALVEKIEPLGGYLAATDPDKLRSDVASYGAKAKAKAGTAAAKVNQKQQAATAKVSQAGQKTANQVKSKPALPIAGALSVLALVGLRMRKAKAQQPKPLPEAQLDDSLETLTMPHPTSSPVAGDDRLDLTRAQLRDQAAAAGLQMGPEATKRELIDALNAADRPQ